MATSTQPSDPLAPEAMEVAAVKRRWPLWQIGAICLVLISGGISFSATTLLLKLPKTPNCPSIYLPFASAAKRLYCAQVKAENNTVESLLAAIKLVNVLGKDHPLRNEINRNIERWSVDILNLAEERFQEGQLAEAIAAAQQIPQDSEAYQVVAQKIEGWQALWSEAEAIQQELEQALRKTNWDLSFRAAVKLAYLDNHYWATTQYEKNIQKIQLARAESRKLDGAYEALEKDGVDHWIEAVNLALVIEEDSYVYAAAQEIIAKAKGKLSDRLHVFVERRQWQNLQEATNQLPAILKFGARISAWKDLANAGLMSESGTISGLEGAIAQAQKLNPDRPLYQEAQQLIARWELEISDLRYLTRARQFAQPGSVSNLNAAVAEAKKIAAFNPRYEEARREIRRWQRDIQVIEDQPILTRAKRLAQGSNIEAWQAAINQARLISSNRALYPEARQSIRGWQRSIERTQDQPWLDQALLLANRGNYTEAITVAQRIARGRALYGKAQENIQGWQQEVQGLTRLRNAFDVARPGTPDALSQAIRQVQQIPTAAKVYSQGLAALNDWSQQLLVIARSQANRSPTEAIRIARGIPRQASAYEAATTQIAYWQTLLSPTDASDTAPGTEEQSEVQPTSSGINPDTAPRIHPNNHP